MAYCIYAFDEDETTCHPLPEALRQSTTEIVWSWDSGTFALSDWLRLIIVTDDGTRTLSISIDETQRDTDPAWAADGTLYFIRETLADNRVIGQTLYRLDAGSDDPTPVIDLSAAEPDFLTFQIHAGRFAISPDGQFLALNTTYVNDDTPAALWLLNLRDTELTRITTAGDALVNGMPDWMTSDNWLGSSLIFPVNWSSDSTTLTIVIENPFFQIRGIMPAAYQVDIAGGTATPWLDYSNVPDNNTFVFTLVTNNPDHFTFYDRNDEVMFLREVDTLLYANWAAGRVGVSALLEPLQAEPTRLYTALNDDFQFMGGTDYNNYGTDGEIVRAVLAYRVLTFSVR